MNSTLALLSMAMVPFLAYRGFAFGRQFRPLSLVLQQQLAVLTTRIEQNLRGARVVKAFAQEEAEIDAFGRENRTGSTCRRVPPNCARSTSRSWI